MLYRFWWILLNYFSILYFPAGSGGYLLRVVGDGPIARDHFPVSRTLCGALIFPSIASLVGRLLFRQVPSNLQRTILVSVCHGPI